MKPADNVVPRSIENSNTKAILDKLANGLEEFINFGSWILKWDTEKMHGGDENIPITMSFRHFIELTDSISILVRHSSIDPCKLLLRGALETYFGLEYLFEKDTDDRCMAFITWHFNQKIKTYKKLDPTTEQGRHFQKTLDDHFTGSLLLKNNPNIPLAIQNWESLLQKPKYQKAQNEIQRLKSLKEKNPAWYRLFDGPKNIEALAKHLKMSDWYEILYRHWSGPTHGTDIISGKLFSGGKGTVEIPQIRYIKDVQEVVQWTCSLSIKTFQTYINYRLPEKEDEYIKWYQTVKNFYLKINAQEPIITVS